MKPPEEFELSLPLLCLPLVKGVDVPGGDMERFGLGPGEDVPGDLDNGGAYRWEEGLEENGRGVEDAVLEGDICCVCDVSGPVFVVIVFGLDVAVAAVVDTCAVETSEVGDIAEDGLDLA